MGNTISGAGLEGVQRGIEMFERSADRVNKTFEATYEALEYGGPIPDDVVSLSRAAVEMSMAEVQVKASAKVIEAYEELQGVLIDLVA